MYNKPLPDASIWWEEWKRFMFRRPLPMADGEVLPISMLGRIKRSKYPSLSEAEEEMSIPLQAMMLAAFDCVMVHMMNAVAPYKWGPIKDSLCQVISCYDSTLAC